MIVIVLKYFFTICPYIADDGSHTGYEHRAEKIKIRFKAIKLFVTDTRKGAPPIIVTVGRTAQALADALVTKLQEWLEKLGIDSISKVFHVHASITFVL